MKKTLILASIFILMMIIEAGAVDIMTSHYKPLGNESGYDTGGGHDVQIPPEQPEPPLVIDDQLLFDLDQEQPEPAPAVLTVNNRTISINNTEVMVVEGIVHLSNGKAIVLENVKVTIMEGLVVG